MFPFVSWGFLAIDMLRRRRRGGDDWEYVSHRGDWKWKFSRLDVLVYGNFVMTTVYLIGMAILRTSEATAKMGETTKRMNDTVVAMNESTDKSVQMLAAMRDEAQAARRETSAAQRLAVWVAVGTTLIGAIVGGFAGAFAARIVG